MVLLKKKNMVANADGILSSILGVGLAGIVSTLVGAEQVSHNISTDSCF